MPRGRGGPRWSNNRSNFKTKQLGDIAGDKSVDPQAQIVQSGPEFIIPKARSPTGFEKDQIRALRAFRKRVRHGPYYTGPKEQFKVSKITTRRNRTVNPFEDMPTYEKISRPKPRSVPDFSTRKYPLKFFPKELWSAVAPKWRKDKSYAVTSTNDAKTKAEIAGGVEDEREEDGDNEVVDTEEVDTSQNDEEEPEVNLEDDFSDNDSEMGADYNAERYFDGGDDDYGREVEGPDDGGLDM